jgi:MYXO-CTERM domain-containing protein
VNSPSLRIRHSIIAFGFALAALVAPRVGQAQYIDLPGTQPHDLDTATPLDSAQTCGLTCHSAGDSTMTTAMPFDDYIGSMMGNAMRDPLFLAALTIAEQDHAGVGDYCLRCHTPTGFVMGRTRSSSTAALGSDLTSTDREGVTCDNCHRMTETTNLGNAQYVISPDDTRFGPYATIDSIRHPGAATTWLADARFCGTCHELRNPLQPLVDADGNDTGQRFPLDTTYSEWANSDFAVTGNANAQTCQDCHLPRIEGQGYVATNTTAMLRDRPRRHEFVGANAWMLRVLGAMREDVASGEFYDPTFRPYYDSGAMRAEQNLRGAATLEITSAPSTAHAGESIDIVARITNRAGHRLPSGYADGRRVWLAVDLVDDAGIVTPVSGAYDDATSHLDETDPQLRVYQAVHGRAGGVHDGHLVLTDRIVRDSRIPPAGFRPPAGLEPVGADYSGGAGGALRNWDDAHYTVAIPPTARGTLTVRVRARYQSTTREYVEMLASANHTDTRGSELLARYNASGQAAPFDMAEATAMVAIADVAADAGADAMASDAADDAGPGGSGSCACRAAGPSRSHGAGGWVFAVLAVACAMRRRDPRERAMRVAERAG